MLFKIFIHVINFPSPGYLLPKTQDRAPAVLNHPPIVQRQNPSRVFCLAGGWHIKPDREPVKSEIVGDSGIRYSYTDLRDRLLALFRELEIRRKLEIEQYHQNLLDFYNTTTTTPTSTPTPTTTGIGTGTATATATLTLKTESASK